jgi:hypothetical protein
MEQKESKSSKHFIVSLVKSIIRISSGVFSLIFKNIEILIWGLIIAEVLGVLEEF